MEPSAGDPGEIQLGEAARIRSSANTNGSTEPQGEATNPAPFGVRRYDEYDTRRPWPVPTQAELHSELRAWAESARDVVWRHVRHGASAKHRRRPNGSVRTVRHRVLRRSAGRPAPVGRRHDD
jgi:hypothetical protein